MDVDHSFSSSDTNTPQTEHIPETPIQSLLLPLVNQHFTTSPITTIIAMPETLILNGPSTSNMLQDSHVILQLKTLRHFCNLRLIFQLWIIFQFTK